MHKIVITSSRIEVLVNKRWFLTEKWPREGRDNFFLWSMVILPILAQGAYIFDAYYYLTHQCLRGLTFNHSHRLRLSPLLFTN